MKTARYISVLLNTAYILAVFLFAYKTYSQEQNSVYSPLETVITDLNYDSVNDTIIIYKKPAEGDPGLFTKINISLGKYGRTTFIAKDVWDSIDTNFKKENTNAVNSDNIFIKKEDSETFIFLFGFAYGSGREEIAIITISNNKCEMYFHNQLPEPKILLDLDKDGKAELICRNEAEIYDYSNKAAADVGAYSPYLVFKLDKDFILDKKLTEKYNKDYYIWEGLDYNDSIRVFYPTNGERPYKSN